MNKKLVISIVVLAALVLTAVSGAILVTNASAAGVSRLLNRSTGWEQGAPLGNMAGGAAQQGRGGPGPGMKGDDTQMQQDLADALGVTVDELTAAQTKAQAAMLAEGVKQGLITQAQADEATQNTTGRPEGGRWLGYLQQKGLDYQTSLAEALGVSVEDLQAAHVKAQNAAIDRAVAAGNMTQEQADLMKARAALAADTRYQSALQDAYESAIQQAVSDGVITQAQADLLLAQPQNGPHGFGPGFGPDFDGGRGGPGGRGGHGGPGGFPGGQPPAAPTTDTNTNG